MKRLLLLFGTVLISVMLFGQYTENKLPSGLTESTTVGDADYTIIQKNGELIVKAVRMDTIKAYMVEGMTADIPVLDSVSGSTGQFVISDGVGWLSPVSAKYEGGGAYTFGYRSGIKGWGSMVLGGNLNGGQNAATGILSIATGISTVASGLNSFAGGNGSIASGTGAFSFGYYSTASGEYATSLGYQSVASGAYSTASGYFSTASGNYSTASGYSSTANSYAETVIGIYPDTVTPTSATTYQLSDWLFGIGNGTSAGSKSNALVMLKSGNTTAIGDWTIDGDLTVTGDVDFSGSFPTISAYIPEDSTLSTTLLTGVPKYLGDGNTNQFVNTNTVDFELNGDTLVYIGTNATTMYISYNAVSTTSTVSTTVHTYIYINDVLDEQFTGVVFCKTAGEKYPMSGASGLVVLNPNDSVKIYIEADKNCTVVNDHFPVSAFKVK